MVLKEFVDLPKLKSLLPLWARAQVTKKSMATKEFMSKLKDPNDSNYYYWNAEIPGKVYILFKCLFFIILFYFLFLFFIFIIYVDYYFLFIIN